MAATVTLRPAGDPDRSALVALIGDATDARSLFDAIARGRCLVAEAHGRLQAAAFWAPDPVMRGQARIHLQAADATVIGSAPIARLVWYTQTAVLLAGYEPMPEPAITLPALVMVQPAAAHAA